MHFRHALCWVTDLYMVCCDVIRLIIVKKQPTLEVSEDFPQGKSTSNKLCTVLPTVVFFNISIKFLSLFVFCLKSISQFCISQFLKSARVRKSARVFSAHSFFIFFKSANKLKNPP